MAALCMVLFENIPHVCLFTAAGLGLVGVRVSLRKLIRFAARLGAAVLLAYAAAYPWHVFGLLLLQAAALSRPALLSAAAGCSSLCTGKRGACGKRPA